MSLLIIYQDYGEFIAVSSLSQ